MIQYKIQKNIEANKIVIECGFASTADFSGLDFGCVKKIVQILAEFYAEYNLIKPIGFIGNGLIHNPNFIANDSTVFAWTEALENRDAPVSAEAVCFVPEHISKDNIKSLVWHELGHVMDSNFGMALSSDSKIKEMFDDSGYSEDISEFIADSWCEYKTRPRKISSKVGKYIDEYYRREVICC